MALDAAATVKAYVNKRIAAELKAVKVDNIKTLLDHLPRHAEFSLTNIAVGTQEQVVEWAVPIGGDYTIYVAPTTGATAVGFISATVKAGTKLPLGCTVIVANRSAATVAAAAFDVLAFPIGGG